jgi:hypothetical protein
MDLRLPGLWILSLAGWTGLACGHSASPSPPNTAPAVLSISVLEVGHTSARVSARIDPSPAGASFSCHYGRRSSADSLAREGTLEGGTASVDVPVSLAGLEAARRYYLRWEVAGTAGQRSSLLDSLHTLAANQPPETVVSYEPDTLQGEAYLHLTWDGWDADGTVMAFDLKCTRLHEEAPWTRTSRRDSLLAADPANRDPRRMYVRAIDDDGAVDATPAWTLLP